MKRIKKEEQGSFLFPMLVTQLCPQGPKDDYVGAV